MYILTVAADRSIELESESAQQAFKIAKADRASG
jgi:hypothetical protein